LSKSKYANWYADRAWRAKRAAHLAKEPLCRYCAREGRLTPGDVADHIEPHKGDRQKFWKGELMTLCHTCHSSVKQREELGIKSRIEKRDDPDSHWRR
jgi:5-methylcytosine-specific restriction protein A